MVTEDIAVVPELEGHIQSITGVSPWLTEGDVFISERRKKRRLFTRSTSPSIHLSDAHLNLKQASASAFYLEHQIVTLICSLSNVSIAALSFSFVPFPHQLV